MRGNSPVPFAIGTPASGAFPPIREIVDWFAEVESHAELLSHVLPVWGMMGFISTARSRSARAAVFRTVRRRGSSSGVLASCRGGLVDVFVAQADESQIACRFSRKASA
ncbi:MAG: hypothetical protein U0231_14995 [Nitrospiraceae bacterium]